ncbi:hypothetical protein GOP47_0024899 [Adiantum capillus-veneris]|nr:hypothetical protein GOP47_0024899 [Adiantum capillus-veneris]
MRMVKEASAPVVVVVVVMMVWMIELPPAAMAQGRVSCDTVSQDITSCAPYVAAASGSSSSTSKPQEGDACCEGVKQLNSRAESGQQARQDICYCLKDLATKYNLNTDYIASIPSQCGVSVRYPLRADIDCSQIQ